MSNILLADSESTGPGLRRGETGELNGVTGASPPRNVSLMESISTAVVLFLLLTAITGIAYPLAVTLVAAVAFPSASTGSLIHDGERTVGSELVGQPFDDVRYFWGRPSASAPVYNGLGGSGSNQATTNPALHDAARDRAASLRGADPDNKNSIPIELVTASASGLDPHVSPAAAQYQAARVARVRGISLDKVNALIKDHTEVPTMGFLGQPRINILKLNRSLDAVK